MKTSNIFLFLVGIVLCEHSQISAISLKQFICAGMLAQSVRGDCTVYNTMKEDVTIRNSYYGLFTHRVPISATVIPANNSLDISDCIHLDIVSHDDLDIKKIGLLSRDQPHLAPRAFTVVQEPCYYDCQGAIKQVSLISGLPASRTSLPVDQLSDKELVYLTYQLAYNSGTITHSCRLRGGKK